MAKAVVIAPRFGSRHWVKRLDTGEHVRVESWSDLAGAYRVRSRKNGLQLTSDANLEDICEHPEAGELGRYWKACPVAGCGAPLTPDLEICPKCEAPTCTCGRCQCVRGQVRAKKPRKKVAAKA